MQNKKNKKKILTNLHDKDNDLILNNKNIENNIEKLNTTNSESFVEKNDLNVLPKETEEKINNFNHKIDSVKGIKKSFRAMVKKTMFEVFIEEANKLNELNKDIESYLENTNLDKGGYSKKISFSFKKINKNIYKFVKLIIKNKKHNPIIELEKNEIISLEKLSKFYSTKLINSKVLFDINLKIYEGEFIVILGPSGSGKTSLMNIISGIDQSTYGSINVAGYNLNHLSNYELTNFRKKMIGYIFQRYGLLPNLSVFENIAMGLFLGENSSKCDSKFISSIISNKDKENILKIIDWVDLANCVNKYPYELSGGQKQRVSIARTIAKNPKIIFGDEPTAAVDSEMSVSIIDLFCKINKEYKTTVILVTHDEKIAENADRVIYMKDGFIEKIIQNDKKEN